jgi:hypothetical protein
VGEDLQSDITFSRVIVTGADGFIGKVLVKSLEQFGAEVYPITRRNSQVVSLSDERSVGKFLEEVQPTSVVHLAFQRNTSLIRTDHERKKFENVQLLRNLINAIRSYNSNVHLIQIGSCAEYGFAQLPYRENSNLEFGSAEYFRNHGVFEGWTLEKGGIRDALVQQVALMFSAGRPLENHRFPTSSLVFSENISDVTRIDRLCLSYPGLDLWVEGDSIFAIHLGLPTKSGLVSSGSWNLLKREIIELNLSN